MSGGDGVDTVAGEGGNDVITGGVGRRRARRRRGARHARRRRRRRLAVGRRRARPAAAGRPGPTRSPAARASTRSPTRTGRTARRCASASTAPPTTARTERPTRSVADVENVVGSPGPDTITGDAAANDLDGGASNDTIDPGAGPDFVDAGPGDDRVTARDGAQDRIECGDGVDTAVTDEFDTASGCEVVEASRELMSDVDNDGVPAPADCDDRNAAVRPGLPDKPGNRVDEDCAGGDAPFARIVTPVQSGFRVLRAFTRVTRLRVLDVPAGATIQLRCKGGKQARLLQGRQARAACRAAPPRRTSSASCASASCEPQSPPRGARQARRLDRQGRALRRPGPQAPEDDAALPPAGREAPGALLRPLSGSRSPLRTSGRAAAAARRGRTRRAGGAGRRRGSGTRAG